VREGRSRGTAPHHVPESLNSRYEHPLVAPQLGHEWQLPARCMMSPHTWQSTVSDARITCVPGVSGGSDAGVIAADGARSSSGSSGYAGSLAIAASSTPGSVGWVRSPTVRTRASRLA
jgi:hypothetical protein